MRSVQGLLVALLCAAPAVAHADGKAAAEAAFVKAKRLLKEGEVAEACAQFKLSQELDPQIGTQYNLALCYEQEGRTASAWLLFREVAQLDSNAKRKKDSVKRAAALEPKLTKLLVTTSATPGLTITREGVDVTRLVGVEDPIDPGSYTLVASAPGYVEHTVEVDVRADKGAVITVEIPALKRVDETPPDDGDDGDGDGDDGGGRVDPPDGREVPDPEPRNGGGGGGGGRKLLALGIGGAGVVAVGVGLVFGAQASSSWGEVEDLCGSDLMCPDQASFDEASGLVDDTRSKGNLSTILVGAGAAAIVTGVILYITAPDGGGESSAQALRVQPEAGGASLVYAGGF